MRSWALLLGLAACGGDPAEVQETASPVALDGEALYGWHCSSCHGLDGQGVTGPDLTRRTQNWSVEEVASVAMIGSGYMEPAQVDLEEATSIATHVLQLADSQ
jgi:mono/diheme cytochrome c family protein